MLARELRATNNRGFTLLEIIISVAIITILGAMAGRGLVEIAKGYALSRKNAAVVQQGQITAARLKKEFSAINKIRCGGTSIVTYEIKRSDSEAVDVSSIYWAGGNNPIMLKTSSDCTVCTSPCSNGVILADNVSAFTINYCTTTANCSSTFPDNPNNITESTVSFIKFTLKLEGYDDTPIPIADPDIVFLSLESGV